MSRKKWNKYILQEIKDITHNGHSQSSYILKDKAKFPLSKNT